MIGKVFCLRNKFKTNEGGTERLKILNWMSGFTPPPEPQDGADSGLWVRLQGRGGGAAEERQRRQGGGQPRPRRVSLRSPRQELGGGCHGQKLPGKSQQRSVLLLLLPFFKKIENPRNQLHLQLNRTITKIEKFCIVKIQITQFCLYTKRWRFFYFCKVCILWKDDFSKTTPKKYNFWTTNGFIMFHYPQS